MRALLDAILLGVEATLVVEGDPLPPPDHAALRLRAGVLDDVRQLARHGIELGAVTRVGTVADWQLRGLLAACGLGPLFQVLVTPVDLGAGGAAPDGAVLGVAADRLSAADRSRVLYVGDGPSDEGAARAAGLHYVGTDHDGVRAAVERWIDATAGVRFHRAVGAVGGPDAVAAREAADVHSRLTKPQGALGRLEHIGIQLAAMAGSCPPPVPQPAAVAIFAGDHGVVAQGVSPWPAEVTAQMVANFVAGGAAINVLARHAEVDVIVVDVGVATPLAADGPVVHRRVRPGTADLANGPAMRVVEARQALDVGVEVATTAVANGARCLLTGDMGIGNTTPSAAVIAALTRRPGAEVTGRGTGIDDATLERKIALVQAAVGRLAPHLDAVSVLAEVGGLEIAALAGFIVGGAAQRVPVIVDGVAASAGLLAATALSPGCIHWCIAGHRSVEPGAAAALQHLSLTPVLDLDLRLGEGTGATLALSLVQAAAKVLREMATFDRAGVAQLPVVDRHGLGDAGDG